MNVTREMEANNMDHHQHHNNHCVNDVHPEVTYSQGTLVIELKDKHGDVPELQVSHEKIMHLIVMRADLSQYHHLHPEKQADGKYVQKIDRSESTRLNSSHVAISYAVFCLKKKNKKNNT